MIKECAYCGRQFEIENKNSTKIYCTHECYINAQLQKHRKSGKNNTKKCLYCGKEFSPLHWNRKYCSEECAEKMIEQKNNLLKEKRKAQHEAQIYKCEICGKEFIPYNKNCKTCSKECSEIYRKLHYKDYAKNFAQKKSGNIEKKRGRPKCIKTIVSEARKMGMSYGKYVANYGV